MLTRLRSCFRGSRASIGRFALTTAISALLAGTTACGTGANTESADNERLGTGNTTNSESASTSERNVTIPSTASTDSEMFFPTQIQGVEGELRAVPEALLIGRLVLSEDGCLRVDTGRANAYVPIWPPGYTAKSEIQAVRVLNEEDRVVAQTGGNIEAGGGEFPRESLDGIAYLSKRLAQELPRRCAGPYWLVGEVMDSK